MSDTHFVFQQYVRFIVIFLTAVCVLFDASPLS